MNMMKLYYLIKPLIPRAAQLRLRRWRARRVAIQVADVWPIDSAAGVAPPTWKGWPGDQAFALVLSHDVETAGGQQKVRALVDLERSRNMRSCVNFVAERYPVDADLMAELSADGFEIGVHGLKHDGKLFSSLKEFQRRAHLINGYLKDWQAVGVHTPCRHHRLRWHLAFEASYVSSTFDTDPFEPQSDGVGTIFPFTVLDAESGRSHVEIPYTLPQDHTLFVVLGEEGIDIWKQKLAWIAERGGLAFVITHPDYMHFGPGSPGPEEYPHQRYAEFLDHVTATYGDSCWQTLPRDVAQHCSTIQREIQRG